jgi:hypothetical protein
MKDEEIISLWKLQEAKLEQTMAINMQLVKEIKSQKAQKALRSLKIFKAGGVVTGIIYLMILGALLSFAIRHYSPAANYFIVSMGAIFIINVKAVADYIKHLVWASEISYEGSVVEIQEKLARLELSIIAHTRVMFLQLPFWTTFYLSSSWFPQSAAWGYVVLQCTITALFTWLAYWLYKNITIENANKKWFKGLINGSGVKSVREAWEYYHEIEEFKK